MNQVDFAREMDVLPQHVTNWKRRGMPPEHNQKAAQVLRCTVDQLLGLTRGAEHQTSPDWPFRFAPERWSSLSPPQRKEIEEVVERMVRAYEAGNAPSKSKSRPVRKAG